MGETDELSVPERRSADAQLALLGEAVAGLREDILAVRHAAVDGIKQLDGRLHLLEDVRVRALEDWRLSQKVLETERTRVADERAEDAAAAKRQQLTRRQFWTGVLITALVTIVSALIAGGQLF